MLHRVDGHANLMAAYYFVRGPAAGGLTTFTFGFCLIPVGRLRGRREPPSYPDGRVSRLDIMPRMEWARSELIDDVLKLTERRGDIHDMQAIWL
jgi:hypothetical protein